MSYQVKLQSLSPRILAAVRRRVAIKDIPTAFKPALDKVWAFLGKHPGLRTDGHNIFLYHRESPEIMPIDFAVEVIRSFVGEGDIACVPTPAGEAAVVATADRILSLATRTRRCINGAPRTAAPSEPIASKFMATGPRIPKNWRPRSNTCCGEPAE